MNTKIYHSLYTLFVAGALLVSGCSNDDDTYDFYAAHPDAVRFNITAGDMPQTRANTEANGASFIDDDQIAISADGGASYSNYVQSSGDDWLPAAGQSYLRWKEQTLSFQAYYPVTQGTDYTHFTVPTSQPDQVLLRKADYMTAEATNQSSDKPVALAFKHRLAKVTVSVTLSEELKDKRIFQLTFHTKGHILEKGNIKDNTADVKYFPYYVDGKYMVVLPPQSENNSAAFIKINLDRTADYTFTGIPELKPGKAYTLALQIGHDGVKLVSPITVKDWEDTKNMTGGTATDLTIWDGKYPTSDAEAKAWMGEETSGANDPTAANHVFTIKAARQLAALQYLIENDVKLNGVQGTATTGGKTTGDGYGDATYNLATDIDLNNKSWTAIGYLKQEGGKVVKFTGTFNGQGHTVSGMNITGDTYRAAFLGEVSGTVKHLNVKGSINVQTQGRLSCGGIVSVLDKGTIAFCSFQGSMTANGNNDSDLGGITGYFATGSIISCYSVISQLETGINNKGGIAGNLFGSTIKGCYWQKLTGLDDTNPYGSSNSSATLENNDSFTDATEANTDAVINAMNGYDADYDYHWQTATDGGYPVLVKKQP